MSVTAQARPFSVRIFWPHAQRRHLLPQNGWSAKYSTKMALKLWMMPVGYGDDEVESGSFAVFALEPDTAVMQFY